MKFRFCGGLDCPDWLLAEIPLLSRVSSLRLKLLAREVARPPPLDMARITKLSGEYCASASDTRALVAALDTIVRQAARFQVDEAALGAELMQLGLPRENGEAICRAVRESGDRLRREGLGSVRMQAGTEIIGPPREALRWRVDQIVSSSSLGPAVTAEVEMQFSNGVAVAMTAAEFRELHASLRAAKGIMDDI
eukprot:TRINITY_DN5626_c1_g2_i1.p2 TRINITY_DN5626_c1_g2~~TRINITY_DN5626_c1_g2_i1.p2  ORF type:complete len:203 (+),score=97.87 TRINITY_DN5626_c1_g2_i1:29-610(+)